MNIPNVPRPLSAAEVEAVSGGVLLLYWLLTRPAY